MESREWIPPAMYSQVWVRVPCARVPKNNLEARIKQWEADNASARGKSTKMHKPGSQKK